MGVVFAVSFCWKCKVHPATRERGLLGGGNGDTLYFLKLAASAIAAAGKALARAL